MDSALRGFVDIGKNRYKTARAAVVQTYLCWGGVLVKSAESILLTSQNGSRFCHICRIFQKFKGVLLLLYFMFVEFDTFR